MSTVFLFGGQGSQTPGMGDELRESSAVARAVFEEAGAAVDFPLLERMSKGPADALRRTEVAQPALLTITVAHARELIARGITPDYAMGHSLGQYGALVIAGALDFADGLRLVSERGRLMQAAVPEGEGAMFAIVGVDRDEVVNACQTAATHGIVEIACHNTEGQTAISGTPAAVEAAADALEEEGAGVVPLEVSAPFHCSLLAPIRDDFRRCLEAVPFRAPELPVIDNVSARPLESADAVRDALLEQVTAPVLFEESLCWLAERGDVDRAIQCGPGKQLLGFARRILREARGETFDEVASPTAAA
ncbi:MAG: ACP S-malonyltransferase [Myxococcota bacterium]